MKGASPHERAAEEEQGCCCQRCCAAGPQVQTGLTSKGKPCGLNSYDESMLGSVYPPQDNPDLKLGHMESEAGYIDPGAYVALTVDLLPKLFSDQQRLIISAAALFEFLFSIVGFTVGAHRPANSGFPPALQTEPVFVGCVFARVGTWQLSSLKGPKPQPKPPFKKHLDESAGAILIASWPGKKKKENMKKRIER
ncbi:hypothetical protein EYF80_046426 [Liparis tanakae]|uniref:Uncharacterized protein n=1 Tax=Liparis tanakae TaxID=230148 RepID=A0A4Z2FQG4_9TELE|nr:hypothetical protein EYF80_046426 [Liparis tanakae]